MFHRSFSRSFYKVINTGDCDNTGEISARMLADKQAGQWDVWFYAPSADPSGTAKTSDDVGVPFEIVGGTQQQLSIDCENQSYLVAAASTI